jgi:uncharacterized protein (DUF488 family)
MKKIWTIGHSTHTLEEFFALLKSHQIAGIADIRRYPGSKRFPHFNRDNLEKTLREEGMEYRHFEGLGGRRSPKPDSKNSGWRVAAFRGYADYMESDEFKEQVLILEDYAASKAIAYMCSEAVWWSCHRALVSDFLKNRGWTVLHIMSNTKVDEHPWTKPARIVEGELVYSPPGVLNL